MKKIKLTENQLHRVIKESVKKILREEWQNEQYPSYQDWSDFLHGKEPMFEFYNQEDDDYDSIYADYNEENGTLQSGSVTNIGFHPNGDVEVSVEDGDFDSAINEFYDELTNIEYQKGYEPL